MRMTILGVVVCATCIGCEVTGATARQTTRTAPLRRNEMKQAVRQKLPQLNPQPTAPGIVPAINRTFHGNPPNERVYWIRHDRFGNDDGQYAALRSDPANWGTPGIVETTPLPIPDITIYNGWLYVAGDAPCVGTTAVIAQATGCTVLLQYYTEAGKIYHRVYFLGGDPDQFVWLYKRPHASGSAAGAMLTVGTYADAEEDAATHEFKNWKGKNTGEPPDIQFFAENEAYYSQIKAQVEQAQADNDVP
jgi:hypothetical protein